MHESEPWWGKHTLVEQQTKHWSIGERKIVIQRLNSEWNTWNIEKKQENLETLSHGEWVEEAKLDNESLNRILQTKTGEHISVMPALADRSVVARPNVPLRLLSNERTLIYVSTPLWFKALILPDQFCILDIPFWRPSDSWFGTSTMEGELCYAKYTEARLQLELLEKRPHRAITPICVHNKQKEELLIERLSVPVPFLSLYSDTDTQLWTNTINITRETSNDMVELVLEKQAPAEAIDASILSSPRVVSEKNTLVRAIGNLFA